MGSDRAVHPAAERPYVGGSTNDSVLQLALGYNGLGRLDGNETGSVGFGGGGGGSAFGGAAGLSRLFASDMGGQISWLLPAALISLAALVWLSWRRQRTDRVRAAAMLWGGWLIVTGPAFSTGRHHPPVLHRGPGAGPRRAGRHRGGHRLADPAQHARQAGALAARSVLAAGLIVTAWWAFVLLGRSARWPPWLRPLVLVCGVAAAVVVIAERWLPGRALLLSVAPLALVASLAGPLAYSLDTAATVHTGALPTAGPSVASFGGPGRARPRVRRRPPGRRLRRPRRLGLGRLSDGRLTDGRLSIGRPGIWRLSDGGPGRYLGRPGAPPGVSPAARPGDREGSPAARVAVSGAAWAAAPRSPARSRRC